MSSIAILITAYKEPTVAKLLDSIFDPKNNNFNQCMTVYLSAPDYETKQVAQNSAIKWNQLSNFIILTDLGQGKPSALNLALSQINADWVICTDGDVFLDANSIDNLIKTIDSNEISGLGAISGRPVSNDSKSNFWGYIGHLLADAAHTKRNEVYKLGESYFVSGYLVAYQKKLLKDLPFNTLIDDAQFSCQIIEQGYQIGYQPRATVKIKYPSNLTDWINQKRRSAGGYRELKKDFPKLFYAGKTRSLWSELSFFLFPFKYAKSPLELIYSLILFPLRLYLWILIWLDGVSKKDNLWTRIESTK